MVVYRVAGVLALLLVLMLLVYGKILAKVGLLCLAIFYMKLVMGQG